MSASPPTSDSRSFRRPALWLLAIALVAIGGLAGWAIGQTGDDEAAPTTAPMTPPIDRTAPAFTAQELSRLPRTDWITNGGTLANQRYSPLDEIDTSNVGDLKGVWLTHLRKSAMAAKYSAEGQPIVYRGVIYIPTGEDDVFAVSVATGKILWQYQGNLSQKIDTVCCGWVSRGVALGEGKVYIGKLDGSLVALDQATGKPDWTVKVGDWRQGYTITHAPLYYDGMVIVGGSGGEFSIRGRLQAYDAKTGKLRWRFHTIPGPGEVGHDSWPKDNDAWKHGGAPIWQTPAVDPELGLVYFSTGNASPDLDGSGRAGDNLFTASIVAIDAKTGKYRWHFQQVHHDIWDYDSPSPVVLFDVGGRKGIAEASKTGWLYLLDRTNGKPLYGIDEKPVKQDPSQKTARTQPIPRTPPFIRHQVDDKAFQEIQDLAPKSAEGTPPKVVKATEMYEPFGKEVRVIAPGPQGGVNWPPISYNPDTKMFYVCAVQSVSGYTRSGKLLAEAKQGRAADVGSAFTLTGFGSQPGTFTAIDATDGSIAWQHRWPDACYSGTTTTAGGLVFVGRSNGELQAYDAEDGKQLWRFQTGAGANSTASFFEQDGKEYVVFYAGGNSLAASPHGDNLWLFSLDGELGPVEAPGAGQGAGHAGEAPTQPTNGKGDPAAGKAVFADNCSGCHGLSGQGGNGGPDLTAIPTAKQLQRVSAQVRNGGGGMPAFKGTLSQKQIQDVSAYVVRDITHGTTGK